MPIYWSTGLFETDRKHIGFGAVIDADHPALAPTGCDFWMDEFWRKLFTDGKRNATSYRLEGLPADFRPIITVVPDLHHSYFISPFFEVQVGEGRLLVCGLNLDANSAAARLFRRSLWRYAASDDFMPKWKVGLDWFDNVFLAPAKASARRSPAVLDEDTRDMMNVQQSAPRKIKRKRK